MLIEYEAASPRVKAVYDDIRSTRKTEYINSFWKALANDPPTLERTWDDLQNRDDAGRARSAHQRADLRRRIRHQWLRLLHRQPHSLCTCQGYKSRKCFVNWFMA